MTCVYCQDFRACFPGQQVPPHDCAGDLEPLATITLTMAELRQVERALELTACLADGMRVSDDTLIGLCELRGRFLDALEEVTA